MIALLWIALALAKPPAVVGHDSQVTAVSVAANRQVVATGDQQGTVLLWRSEQPAVLLLESEPRGEVQQLAVSDDGARVASVHPDGTFTVVKSANGATLMSETVDLTDPDLGREPVWSMRTVDSRVVGPSCGSFEYRPPAPVFSPDGRRIAVAGRDRRVPQQFGWPIVRVWNVRTSRVEATYLFKRVATPLRFEPDGDLLVHAGSSLLLLGEQPETLVADGADWAAVDYLGELRWGSPMARYLLFPNLAQVEDYTSPDIAVRNGHVVFVEDSSKASAPPR